MEKERLLLLLEDYSRIVTEYTHPDTITNFLKEHGIIKNEESQLDLMHWNSTAYSYFQIPQIITEKNINSDIADEYEVFLSKEKFLVEKLRESHLNILLKIVNDEMELGSGKA